MLAHPHLRAMILALLAYNIWTAGDAMIKFVGLAGVPISHILVPFSLSGMLTIMLVASWRGKVRTLIPRRLVPETIRSFITTGLGVANVIAFTQLPLTLCYAVTFIAPIPIAIIAAKTMRETLSWSHYACMTLGFLGVLLALNPTNIDFSDGQLWGYIALPFCLAFAVAHMLMTRMAGRSDDSAESMAFYPQLVRLILVMPFFIWQFQMLEAWQWLFVFGMGISSSMAWLLMTSAMKAAPAAVVSQMQYSKIVGGALISYLVWNDIPSWHLVAGSIIIIAASLYMARLTAVQTKVQNA